MMGTKIRPELSEKNRYWIERHRYYELKHFCLQYNIWKKEYSMLDGLCEKTSDVISFSKQRNPGDPTASCAEKKMFYSERIDMLENTALETDPVLGCYILKGVTSGLSYDHMKAGLNIPCCKDAYYELYRRFFWLLDKKRS